MSYLVQQHMSVSDPFLRGDSAPQLGFMMNLTRGLMFPWRAGGVALLRRELYPDVHAWGYVGLAIGADVQIKNYAGMGHKVSQAYQYTAVRFLGNGMISTMHEPVRLDFDGAGALITPGLPNFPVNVAADPLAGGKFKVTFEYDPFGQGGAAKDFQVFEGPDENNVDYLTPLVDSETGLNVVRSVAGRRAYSFTTPVYGDLTVHVFSVRARNGGGVAELNTFTTASKVARSSTPVAAAAPVKLLVRPYSRQGTG